MMTTRNKNTGSSFDSFLSEEGILEDVTDVAVKRVLAWQIEEERKNLNLSKKKLASEMKVTDAQLLRLLDPENTGVTLRTMTRVARVLGMHVEIKLVRNDRISA